jgi:hypothetical protein
VGHFFWGLLSSPDRPAWPFELSSEIDGQVSPQRRETRDECSQVTGPCVFRQRPMPEDTWSESQESAQESESYAALLLGRSIPLLQGLDPARF